MEIHVKLFWLVIHQLNIHLMNSNCTRAIHGLQRNDHDQRDAIESAKVAEFIKMANYLDKMTQLLKMETISSNKAGKELVHSEFLFVFPLVVL